MEGNSRCFQIFFVASQVHEPDEKKICKGLDDKHKRNDKNHIPLCMLSYVIILYDSLAISSSVFLLLALIWSFPVIGSPVDLKPIRWLVAVDVRPVSTSWRCFMIDVRHLPRPSSSDDNVSVPISVDLPSKWSKK